MSLLIGKITDMFRNSVQSTALSVFQCFQGVFCTVLALVVTGTLVIWLSIFIYGAFYYSYMPTSAQYTKPVNLQFQPCFDEHGACSFLSANVSLTKKGDDQMFIRGLPYSIQFDLEMPESPTNLEAVFPEQRCNGQLMRSGMFMIKIQLFTKKGDVVITSGRSAVLRYKSKLVQTINAFMSVWSLLFGQYEEKQTITVELLEDYEEDTYKPAVAANIEVQSKFVQVYSAQLRIVAKFTGIRYLLFHYPVMSAAFGVGTTMYFLIIIATLSWWRYLGAPTAGAVVTSVLSVIPPPPSLGDVTRTCVPTFLRPWSRVEEVSSSEDSESTLKDSDTTLKKSESSTKALMEEDDE